MYTCRLKTKMSTKVIGELLRLFFHENSRVDFVNKFEAHFLLVLKIFFFKAMETKRKTSVNIFSFIIDFFQTRAIYNWRCLLKGVMY